MSATEGVVIDPAAQKPPLTASVTQIAKILKVMEDQILPVTAAGVAAGNKVFGAAVLDGDLNLTLAGTNSETECPLFHGEVKVIYEWSKITPAAQRGAAAQSSVFFATHEPCCMCVSSILWSGFPRIFYFFPYSITSAQGIPHDINTMVSTTYVSYLLLFVLSSLSSFDWICPQYEVLTPCIVFFLASNNSTNSGASIRIANATNTLLRPVSWT